MKKDRGGIFVKTAVLALLTWIAAGTLGGTRAEERWPRWYLGVSGGLAMHNDSDLSTGGSFEFDEGTALNGAVGYLPHFGNGFVDMLRFEAEISYLNNDVDTFAGVGANGKLDTLAYLFNTYIDIPTETGFTPYLGFGVGTAKVELSSGGVSEDDTAFAYQFRGGVGYAPESLPMTEFSIGYRYFATGKASYSYGDLENSSHNLEAGLKFRF